MTGSAVKCFSTSVVRPLHNDIFQRGELEGGEGARSRLAGGAGGFIRHSKLCDSTWFWLLFQEIDQGSGGRWQGEL